MVLIILGIVLFCEAVYIFGFHKLGGNMDGWINTKERMPDTRGEIGHSLCVLIYKPHNQCCFLAVWTGFYGWQNWTNQEQHLENEVSHWMPTPDPPKI